MYVNDTERGHIRVFDVRGDGTFAGGRVFAQLAAKAPAHRTE